MLLPHVQKQLLIFSVGWGLLFVTLHLYNNLTFSEPFLEAGSKEGVEEIYKTGDPKARGGGGGGPF